MRIDRLLKSGLNIAQDSKGFCLNIDTVLLAGFPSLAGVKHVLELGSGSGGILLLLKSRKPALDLTGVELNREAYSLLEKTLSINGLENEISIMNRDIRKLEKTGRPFDMVISNPPYIKKEAFRKSASEQKRNARTEVHGCFSDFAACAASLLKNRGRFVFIHRSERLAGIVRDLEENGLSLKKLRFVHPFAGRASGEMLAEAVKGGAPGLSVLPPLIVYNEPGKYTEEVMGYYKHDT